MRRAACAPGAGLDAGEGKNMASTENMTARNLTLALHTDLQNLATYEGNRR